MSRIIDIIRKLMSHADSARSIGNVAEAETFAAKAQELLYQHKLNMTDVEVAEEEKNEPILDEFLTAEELTVSNDVSAQRKSSWVGILLMGVGAPNFCRVIGSNLSNAYHLIGRETDRQTTLTLFRYLYDACNEMATSQANTYKFTDEYRRMVESGRQPKHVIRTFISGFKLGFATAIHKRLEKQQQQLTAAATGTALMRLDQIEKALDNHVAAQFPRLTFAKTRTRGVAGFAAGQAYGGSVGINSSKRLKG